MTAYELALLVVFVASLGIRSVYQRRRRGATAVSTRHSRREQLSYLLVASSYLLLPIVVFTNWLDAGAFDLPGWLRWLGALIAAAGLALFWWTHVALGRNWSGVLELYEQHELVMEGPYRFVRHPMYTSVYLKGIGILLLSANWIAGGGYLAAVTWMYALRVRDEEQMMVERFGEEYRNYMNRTSRLVPLPRR